MYFTRLFGAGLDKNRRDPRDKIWAEFHCALCGENSEIDVTGNRNTFQFHVERRCPKCGQLNANDKALNLKAQLEKLTSDKSRIEIEIDQIERELNELNGNTSGMPEFQAQLKGKNETHNRQR
jgi:hypothetical protein